MKKSSNKNQSVLITGISGFVGSRLAIRLVREGYDVHGITREKTNTQQLEAIINQLSLHTHDTSTESLIDIIKTVSPEMVYHIASDVTAEHTAVDVSRLIDNNIKFSTQLVEAMVTNSCTNLINTGTFWQHYNNEDYHPVCLYAATKQAFEMILEHYIQNDNLNVITLKLYDTYGPDDPRPKIISLLHNIASTGNSLKMTAGEQLIDMVYIDDVLSAYQIASTELLQRKEKMHKKYAISSGEPIRLVDFVKVFEAVSKKKLLIEWGAKSYRGKEVMVPWNNGKILPGWSPHIPLEEGLRMIFK